MIDKNTKNQKSKLIPKTTLLERHNKITRLDRCYKQIIFVLAMVGTNLNLFVSGMMMKKVEISHVFVTDKVGERKQQLIYPSTLRRLHFYFVRMLLALSLSLSLSQTHTLSHANVLYYFSPTYFLEKCLVNEVKRNQKCCTVTFFSILQL